MSWWKQWWNKYGDRTKYDLLKYGVLALLGSFTGLGIWFREWLSGQSWIVLSLLAAVAALSVACVALFVALIRTRKALNAAVIKKQTRVRSFEDMLNKVRLDRGTAQAEPRAPAVLTSPATDELGLGPESAEIMGRMLTEDLVLESWEESYGISVCVHNNGIVAVHNIKLELTAVTTFHKDKGQFRGLKRETVTFLPGRTLQPDEKSEAHRVAFLSHTGKIEISLPERSYVPNPEMRPQVFRATYQLSTDQGSRTEHVYFAWKPKENPALLQEATIRDLSTEP
jgi:hypothetical protein